MGDYYGPARPDNSDPSRHRHKRRRRDEMHGRDRYGGPPGDSWRRHDRPRHEERRWDSRDRRRGPQDDRQRWRNGDSRRQRGPKGAPLRFGSRGNALAKGADPPNCTRVDAEGMVYMVQGGGARYFQDRKRQYPFEAGQDGLALLKGLLDANEVILPLSQKRLHETGDEDALLKEGERLYAEKPTMKRHHGAKGTWSDAEYAHPGLQHVYLRLKSFQRFTESWALFERAASYGIFDDLIVPPGSDVADAESVVVCSLGGGPGYELLAFEWFMRFWAHVRRRGGDGRRTTVAREARAAWLEKQAFSVRRAPEKIAGSEGKDGSASTEACTTSTPGTGGEQEDSDEKPGKRSGGSVDGVGSDAKAAEEVEKPEEAEEAEKAEETEEAVNVEDAEDAEDAGPGLPGEKGSLPQPPAEAVEGATSEELAPLDFISLDLQPSWEPFVRALGYRFAAYDLHGSTTPTEAAARDRLDICIISNVLNYCTDEASADLLVGLLQNGTRCILLNERGAEQRMVEFVMQRGVRVVRLLSQEGCGRDDRQMIFFPPEQPPEGDGADSGRSRDLEFVSYEQQEAPPHAELVFPNVPYEERKFQAHGRR